MENRLIYLITVVFAGWLVTFTLRALPFVIFAGKNRELPRWVEKLGNIVSPVIIGGLIFYSYSGLEWRTAWPYFAGVLTVSLQLKWRNPLVSIICGTIAYMVLVSCCGCAKKTLELNAQHPAISYSVDGVKFDEKFVEPKEIPKILESYDVPHDRTIHILLEPGTVNLKPARTLLYTIRRGGYPNVILVTSRHGDSMVTPPLKRR